MKNKKPTVLIIMDGWGESPKNNGNAIALAKTPFIDEIKQKYPFTFLNATGKAVGLNENQMSGSEAGHINIGGGRVVIQEAYRIDCAIENGDFFKNPVFIDAVRNCKIKKSNLHIMGLLSTYDSQHINPEHFRMLLRLSKQNSIKQVYCHLFTDGRDSYQKSALVHLKYYQKMMKEEGVGVIASISGRFWAMDRAKNWDRLAKAYKAIVFSEGMKASSAKDAIKKAYQRGETDEVILPTVIFKKNKPVAKIEENDSLIFYNFRSDRARQFTKLFVKVDDEIKKNDKLPKLKKIKNLYFVAMADFGPDMDVHTAFVEKPLINSLPMILKGIKQLYISESEKYAHMTYFFNGGYPKPVGGEDRQIIMSPNVGSYAEAPRMSAQKITNYILEKIKKNKYDFIAVNFANTDMVGHTGNLKATIQAAEFVNDQVKELTSEILKKNGNILLTADHGNADNMIDFVKGKEIANTFHTKNPVPLCLIGKEFRNRKLFSGGVLGNIAPTILNILKKEKPKEMTENSLLI
ncbi:MAG TPA: 2,3-bisphosphoglycerate-independent phosphoglycerate mutase [Candidatus Moranbacteria bacterium]|nr:2,3-bisphosphoglycerate-independent phosphoglycerate mutase [Candidatus Moranbacteria bacterium]